MKNVSRLVRQLRSVFAGTGLLARVDLKSPRDSAIQDQTYRRGIAVGVRYNVSPRQVRTVDLADIDRLLRHGAMADEPLLRGYRDGVTGRYLIHTTGRVFGTKGVVGFMDAMVLRDGAARYTAGWIDGFYAARGDEGLRHVELTSDRMTREYLDGFGAGVAAVRGRTAIYDTLPRSRQSDAA